MWVRSPDVRAVPGCGLTLSRGGQHSQSNYNPAKYMSPHFVICTVYLTLSKLLNKKIEIGGSCGQIDDNNAFKICIDKSLRKMSLEKSKRRSEDNICMVIELVSFSISCRKIELNSQNKNSKV